MALHLENINLYKQDCQNYFGYIVNHKQSNSVKNRLSLIEKFNNTKVKWLNEFGLELGNDSEMSICESSSDGGWGDGAEFLPEESS